MSINALIGNAFATHLRRVGLRVLNGFHVRIGTGIPHNRDPEHPCEMFEPGPPHHHNRCRGDGHYLCSECHHLEASE